jgi:hypothetical protein
MYSKPPLLECQTLVFKYAASFAAGILLGSRRLITILYCALTIVRAGLLVFRLDILLESEGGAT